MLVHTCVYVKCVERNEIWEDGNRKKTQGAKILKSMRRAAIDDVGIEKEEGTREKK